MPAPCASRSGPRCGRDLTRTVQPRTSRLGLKDLPGGTEAGQNYGGEYLCPRDWGRVLGMECSPPC